MRVPSVTTMCLPCPGARLERRLSRAHAQPSDAERQRAWARSDSDVDFANLGVAESLVNDGQVVGDGFPNVAERFFRYFGMKTTWYLHSHFGVT